jgi:hypothetical protein
MPCRPTMYRDEHGVPIARQEWDWVSQRDPLATSFFAARIQRIAVAANSDSEASPDVYDYSSRIYCYYYSSIFCMYYALLPSQQLSGSDIIVLACGNSQDPNLNQVAHQRRANL